MIETGKSRTLDHRRFDVFFGLRDSRVAGRRLLVLAIEHEFNDHQTYRNQVAHQRSWSSFWYQVTHVGQDSQYLVPGHVCFWTEGLI